MGSCSGPFETDKNDHGQAEAISRLRQAISLPNRRTDSSVSEFPELQLSWPSESRGSAPVF